jgi:hypothetical protein
MNLPTHDRRLVDRLLLHWSRAHCQGGLPSLGDIDPWMIGDDWKDCVLIKVGSPLASSELIAIGEHLLEHPCWQWEPPAVAEVGAGSLIGAVVSRLADALASRDCVVGEGTIVCDDNSILYRCTLLPLSGDGAKIDHVMGAINFKKTEPRQGISVP